MRRMDCVRLWRGWVVPLVGGLLMASPAVIMSQAMARLPVAAPIEVPALPKGEQVRPVQLSKIVVKLGRGEPFGRAKVGLICLAGAPLVWKSGRTQLDGDHFDEVFKEELEEIGYDVVSTVNDMFDEGNDKRAEFLVGGTIKSMAVDACFPNSGLGDLISAKGSAVMEVEWKIYSRLDRKVVESYVTRAGYEQKKTQPAGLEGLVLSAFAQNIRALAASGRLQKAVAGAPTDMRMARRPGSTLPTMEFAAPAAGAGDVREAVGATVLVSSGSGHGSGFLISAEGLFLTNQHVVGSAKFVKLRWSDGVEGLGEVLRTDPGRDVALIKGESRGRRPLRIAPSAFPVGSEVFAIGAPLDRELQNTVTRGVVSAFRVLNGYQFIQSDVTVGPGNSGGPLTTARGDVLGITVSGYRINDAPQGLNFFIPAGEAVDFLGLKSRTAGK